MTLRPTVASMLVSLAPFNTWRWAIGAIVGVVVAASASAVGCGDSGSVVCEPTGGPCQACDALGCRPADSGSGGGSSSSSVTTSSATGGDAGPTGGADGGSDGAGGADDGGDAGDAAPPPCDPTKEACACADGACPTGEDCVSGLCVVACEFTYQCGAGKVCANGACVPGCDTTHACAAGYSCASGACEPDPFNPQCGTSAPCPTGEICVGGLCTTGCTASSQCAAGEICDGVTGSCIPDPSPKPACGSSMPCTAPQACLADGYCHYPCYTLNDCKLVDNRFVACTSGFCQTEDEVSPECTLEDPCPMGQSCISNVCH